MNESIKTVPSLFEDVNPTEKELKRFWDRVDKRGTDDCWTWIGFYGPRKYGHFPFRGRYVRAHRMAWFIEHGVIPKDKPLVLHTCDNTSCVNPKHLWVGTNRDNMLDAVSKGRVFIPIPTSKARGERHGRAILSEQNVSNIRMMRSQGQTLQSLSEEFGVARTTIHHVCVRHSWDHVP